MTMTSNEAVSGTNGNEKLWEHSAPQTTAMYDFMQQTKKKHNLNLNNYHDLHRWSRDNIASFWEDAWHYLGIKCSSPYSKVQ